MKVVYYNVYGDDVLLGQINVSKNATRKRILEKAKNKYSSVGSNAEINVKLDKVKEII